MVESGSATSRRAMLSALAVAPIAGAASWDVALGPPSFAATDQPLSLRRTKEARSLSRMRYHTAEHFLASIEGGSWHLSDQFYQIGIAIQLGLSAHLLDVGFEDAWCAGHIGLNLAKSLAYANATGLSHNSADFERLATFLSPYGKWRNAALQQRPPECPFPGTQIRQLTRDLLERVRQVTGHPRPRGWRGSPL